MLAAPERNLKARHVKGNLPGLVGVVRRALLAYCSSVYDDFMNKNQINSNGKLKRFRQGYCHHQ